jgi:D-amino-acid dehydrogenase
LDALRTAIESAGGVITEGEGVAAIAATGDTVSVQTTAGQTLRAGHVVVATGALTSRLLDRARCRKRILPGKGYSITLARPEVCPRIPLLFQETKTVITPFASGYRIGSTMEFRGFDDSLNAVRLQALRAGIVPYVQPPLPPDGGQEWCGWRPMTHDGVPIISPLRDSPRILLAAGHNMLGVSMAPATGELVAALIAGTATAIDPAPYRAG